MSEPRATGVITTGAELAAMNAHEVDYAIVGSGAGGGAAAAVLADAGAKVAVVEEGGHYTRKDFNMQEAWAYPALYQEHGNRATDDLAIMILQGRNVGGGTTVNWTSSFRTPPATLRLWAERLAATYGDGDVLVYFNNDPGGAAVVDAVHFADAVRTAGGIPTRVPTLAEATGEAWPDEPPRRRGQSTAGSSA